LDPLSSHPSLQVVALLPGVEIVCCHNSNALSAFGYDDGEQSARGGAAIVHEAPRTTCILLVDQDRIVQERLLRLLAFDSVNSNLA
jgi:hypothetical protein